MRIASRRISAARRSSASEPGCATSTACDSKSVAIGRRSLIRRVLPVDTRSQIASATSRAGATSAPPRIPITCASTRCSEKNAWSERG